MTQKVPKIKNELKSNKIENVADLSTYKTPKEKDELIGKIAEVNYKNYYKYETH